MAALEFNCGSATSRPIRRPTAGQSTAKLSSARHSPAARQMLSSQKLWDTKCRSAKRSGSGDRRADILEAVGLLEDPAEIAAVFEGPALQLRAQELVLVEGDHPAGRVAYEGEGEISRRHAAKAGPPEGENRGMIMPEALDRLAGRDLRQGDLDGGAGYLGIDDIAGPQRVRTRACGAL